MAAAAACVFTRAFSNKNTHTWKWVCFFRNVPEWDARERPTIWLCNGNWPDLLNGRFTLCGEIWAISRSKLLNERKEIRLQFRSLLGSNDLIGRSEKSKQTQPKKARQRPQSICMTPKRNLDPLQKPRTMPSSGNFNPKEGSTRLSLSWTHAVLGSCKTRPYKMDAPSCMKSKRASPACASPAASQTARDQVTSSGSPLLLVHSWRNARDEPIIESLFKQLGRKSIFQLPLQ